MFEEDSDEDESSSDPLASERGDPEEDSSDGDTKVDPFQVNSICIESISTCCVKVTVDLVGE